MTLKLGARLRAAGHVIFAHWRLWLAGLGLILAIVIPATVGCNRELGYRIAGLVLQVGGIAVVAIGLRETRSRFGRPGIREQVRDFGQQLWTAFTLPPIEGQAYIPLSALGIEASAESATLTVGKPPTLEDRLRAIEETLRQLRVEQEGARAEARNAAALLESQLSRERQERERSVQAVRHLMEEEAVGGLNLELAGLVWLLLGTVLTTVPQELASLAAFVCR